MILHSGVARRFLVSLLVVPICIWQLPDRVMAQEPGRGETVTERARPELDPLGIRAGSFIFYPQLSVAGKYDDNLYATKTNETDDFITIISPEVQLRSNWSNHALNLYAGGEAGYYSGNDSEDYTDYYVGFDTRLDVSRNSNLTAAAQYQGLHEERWFPNSEIPVGDVSVEPIEYRLLTTRADYRHQFNRFSLGLLGRFDRFDYDNGIRVSDASVINNNDRNRDAWRGALRMGYEVSPGLEFFGRGTYYVVAYDVEAAGDDNGLDRDSTGYEAVAGTAFDVTGVTFGELFAGYRRQEADDVTLQPIEGAQYGGAVTWNPSGLTTIKGDIARSIEETTEAGSLGFFATRYGLAVDHELLRNLLLGLNASYTTRNYDGIDRDDNYVRGGLYAKYLMNRNLYVSLDYGYAERRSNVDEDFVKNVYMLRLQTQY